MLKRARLDGNATALAGTKAIQEFLDVLHERDGIRAFVGGGFPRDLYCGQKPKDIDLYVQRMQFKDAHMILFKKQPKWDMVADGGVIEDSDKPAYQHQSIELQMEAPMKATSFPLQFKLPINLIGIKSAEWNYMERLDKVAERIIGRYDFGMCMACITPSGLWYDDRFKKDIDNKQCTLYRSFGREYAVAHYERFKKKYPWPMVVSAYDSTGGYDTLDDEIPF